MRKKILIAVVIVALLAVGTGFGVLAAGTLGSAEDPLVTLSYLNERFKKELIAELDGKIAEQGLLISARVDEKLGSSETGAVVPADAFLVVTLSMGQTLSCDAGSEFMLRDGSAVVYGAEISNTTAGATAQTGTGVLVNNMYITASSGSGVSVASETARLLVRGNFTILTP